MAGIGLSGLITPSLDEMIHVAKTMEKQGFKVPLLIGGATTSKIHSAMKIAPHYSEPVVRVADASLVVGVVNQLLNPKTGIEARKAFHAENQRLRVHYANTLQRDKLFSITEARSKALRCDWSPARVAVPQKLGLQVLDHIDLQTVATYIDWTPFFHTWELTGYYPNIFEHPAHGQQAKDLFDDAQVILKECIGICFKKACATKPDRRRGRAATQPMTSMQTQPRFLPVTPAECAALGWTQIDILLISGDAYVDHPSFGAAVVGRLLASMGLRVAVAAQPDWHTPDTLRAFGRPRLAVGVTSGNLDSMLCLYTAARRLRKEDAYSPGGRPGMRPPRATTVYANLARAAFPGVPVLLGGIEASLRRLAHYDYWQDRVRPGLLCDAKAEILLYGMAERALAEIVRRLGEMGRNGETERRGNGETERRRNGERRFLIHAGAVVMGGHSRDRPSARRARGGRLRQERRAGDTVFRRGRPRRRRPDALMPHG